MRVTQARRLWLLLHLQIGFWFGAGFALLGLTGSALVFYPELDRLLNPAIRVNVRSPAAAAVSFDAVIAQLRRLHPERQGAWRIELPLNEAAPVNARYYRPVETEHRKFAPLMVTLDPQSLTATSQRFWGDYLMTWLYDLHYTFLFEDIGQTAVGVLGIFLTASLLTGLYLWWPTKAGFLRAIRPKRARSRTQLTYDLHTLTGLYAWLLLMVLALTGVALVFPNATQRGIESLSLPQERAPALEGSSAPGDEPLGLDQAADLALRQFPGAKLRWLETSDDTGAPIKLRLFQLGEPGQRFPQTYVWVHPVERRVLWQQDPQLAPFGSKLLAWIHPLHNGEALGIVGRVLVCIAGLVPALLWGTGLCRWRQKRKARQAAAH